MPVTVIQKPQLVDKVQVPNGGKRSYRRFFIGLLIVVLIAAAGVVFYFRFGDQARSISLSADLTNSVKKLKIYQTQYSSFPTKIDVNQCPLEPVASTDNNYCLKVSTGNNLFSYESKGSNFTLRLYSAGVIMQITDTSSPELVSADKL